ncbi:MAG: SDR family NAD(P)-dependent oxidoreductase [Acidobacteriia bacterium]|nr:SDR family NAD(P)-dependent oxidoreductase [Terriglobia bacterium]
MPLRLFVCSPDGFEQLEVLTAAHAAGCIAVLGLDYLLIEDASSALRLLIHNNCPFWVSIPEITETARTLLAPALDMGLVGVILSAAENGALRESIHWCRENGIESAVQVTSLTAARGAVECGADALIVKGSESGGRVGEETVFILLQRILPLVKIPIYARGGIGLYTGSACLAAGAAGVVLDWQLALAEESSLPAEVKARIARMDASETAILGQDSIARVRAYSRIGEAAFFELKKLEETEGIDAGAAPEALARWRHAVGERITRRELLAIGQDAAFAAYLADQFRTVGGICRAITREASRQVRAAARSNPLGEGAPLAQSHGTRFPILQGPMTRVSDNAAFALAVAQGGALPFLALALMRGHETGKLLDETKRTLGALPWGVGILGFVPKELRDEQLAEVQKYKPPFAIIAGGRPDMAKQFEADGIHVYLHVPSPELARNFLEAGARRLIFEGRECGGHVGPRTSFVLWEQMVRVILQHLRGAGVATKSEDYHIIFAGGIHDARSAAMVAAITAPLTERGVRIGVVIGTGYLFTHEIVSTKAVTPAFQEEAIACHQTVLVESGVGHATRCADSPFAQAFAEEKRRLLQQGKPKEEIRIALEGLNLGRLRIASKGIVRRNDEDGRGVYEQADSAAVKREGMFMIGQVAALRRAACSVEQLHLETAGGGRLLEDRASAMLAEYKTAGPFPNSDIAIVGISCVLPKAADVKEYWQNILNKQYAIEEIPKERWDVDVYFDKDRRSRDKVYSRWGGFIGDVTIDPVKFGMPPSSVPSIEPMQLLALEMVQRALADAGYNERKFDRERTCCIVGAGGGVGELGMGYGFRSLLPHYMDQAGGSLADSAGLIDRLGAGLPEWTEDSFAGLLLNVVAGRVANRFDFGGTNLTVDAACATGLAAVRHAVTELETRSSDTAVVVAVDMMQTPFSYLCFSKTQALSPTGQPRCFDETADGIVISEGIGVAILKRLDDAVLDGDKIYGVLKSVGASSDGKDKGLTAPRPAGQIRAFERAYAKAAFDPRTVGLMEAHGTGTVVGDRTEAESLALYFSKAGAEEESIALGSVKSMIGHTKCTAGMAGLIKAVLALRQRVLPATLGVTRPNTRANEAANPMYVNTETRPWMRRLDGAPRRAGVSAFGFGGTNFHVVLEEHRSPQRSDPPESSFRDWPAELFLFKGKSGQEITSSLDQLATALQQGAGPHPGDLAAAVYWEKGRSQGPHCLAVVAGSCEDLASKLDAAKLAVSAGKEYRDPRGVYYSPQADAPAGKVAFLFPGQGSQSLGMLGDLAIAFPRVHDTFEEADSSLGRQLGRPLSRFIFPPPAFSAEAQEARDKALKQTNVAQPALGAADLAMFRLLADLGIQPQFAAGHSYGEFAALAAAGTFRLPELIRISELRGRLIVESAQGELGTMAAAEAGEAQIAPLLAGIDGVVIANLNSPVQTVISGTAAGIALAVEKLKASGIKARPVPVACAFHSPLVAPASAALRAALNTCDLKPPRFPVFSNTTTQPHSSDPDVMRALLAEHLAEPVRFAGEIAAMYQAGARIFVECGPGKVLTSLASSTLQGKPHTVVAMDQPGRNGLLQLTHALAQLAVAGVPFFSWRLFEGRVTTHLHLDKLLAESGPRTLAPTAWVLHNGKAVPAAKFREPQPRRLADLTVRAAGRPVLLNLPGASEPTGVKGAVLQGTPHLMSSTVMPMPNTPTPPIAAAPIPGPATVVPPRAASAAPLPSAAAAMPAAAGQVQMIVEGHHRLMSKFLETHRNIMLAYLQPQSIPAVAGMPGESYTPLDVPAFAPPPNLPVAPHAAFPATAPLQALAAAAAAAPIAPAVPPANLPTVAALSVVAPAPKFTRVGITSQLVELVSQRTGYPADMLGLDLDLEADLGVDSIKRVEIFGALESESVLPASAMEGQIETLSKLKTLRQIIDWLETKAAEITEPPAVPQALAATVAFPKSNAAPAAAIASPAPAAATELHSKPVTRMLVEVLDAPEASASSVRPRTVLITSDGSAVGQALAARLSDMGIRHRLLEHAPGTALDLCSPAAVASLIDSLRATYGSIDGLVHLLPLVPVTSPQAAEFESRTLTDLKSLFLLTKALEPDLRKSGVVLAATQLGGSFAFRPAQFFAGSGAISGFIKTLPREWPDVSARTVDFESGADPQTIADTLASELLCRDGLTEAAYSHGRRKMLRSLASPLARTPSGIRLDRDSVVLVTGGARGITADTVIELAKTFPARFVLLGRSPLPPEHEPADIAGITEVRRLRAALMDRMQTGGQRPTPALVEGAVKRIQNEREIRANLSALRAVASSVEYHAIDVADAAAVGALIANLYAAYGRIDGVVHGAGVIEDKLIGDKTPESFERVLRPKIAGALALLRALRPDDLQFLVFFSSVSARYGNRGQCDYSAANEVLNKLAQHWNFRWPGRVVSMNWGPWRTEGGMVSPELAARFKAAGVELIEVPAGCRAFVDELLYGTKSDAEVVFGGPLAIEQQMPGLKSSFSEPRPPANSPRPTLALPMQATVTALPGGKFEAHLDTHPDKHIFLRDHQIDGKPVLPMVMALELLTEVALSIKPDAPLTAIRNVRRLNGISYAEGTGRTLRVEGDMCNGAGAPASFDLALKSGAPGQLHYRARIELGGSRPPVPPRIHLVNPRPLPLSVADAYDHWLFHGPMFAGIREVVAIGDNGIIGRVGVSQPQKLICPAPPGSWLIDPVAADSSLQLCLLWIRSMFDQTPLPSGIEAYYHVQPLTGAREILCEIEISAKPGNPNIRCNLRYYDEAGRLLGWMEGLEVTMSKALNRLKTKSAPAGSE